MSGKASRPSLIQRRFWSRRRAYYEAVFNLALLLLRERKELWADEPNLVRELRFTTVTARRKLDPEGHFGSPCFEAQNPPDPDADCVQPFEHKRPDIQWRHDDEGAEDDRHREKSFVIACKRLGAKTASGWDLNEQYVSGGIARFVSLEHKYGHHMSEGMMIGFIQSMEPTVTLSILNRHLAARALAPIQLDGSFITDGVSCLKHELVRGFCVTPFQLAHRWLDIRKVPQRVN
jgi:hypothetical protein